MACQQFTDRKVIEAIEKHGGFIQFAADDLGCSRELLYSRAKASPEIQQAIVAARERGRENRVQQAEKAIDTLLEGCGQYGDPHFGAAELVLSRLGRDRGWAPDKQGASVNVSVQFQVEHLIPEALDPSYIVGEQIEPNALMPVNDADPAPISPSLPPPIKQEPE